jgi:NAD(P)H-dependent flavin oxidoreductase YrpB (nitropropane dioxygenase family)
MHTRVCDELGIEFPIFAFSHCRDVVAAVSRAGGVGVLGALYFTPDELEMELAWIDEHVDGKPYGVDLVMPATLLDAARGSENDAAQLEQDLEQMIPVENREFVEKVLADHGVPPLPEDAPKAHHLLGWTDTTGRAQLDVALEHPAKLLVNALGPPPADVVDKAHDHGMKVAALASTARHALKHQANGVDYIVAQGTEAGGHTGEISSVVLWPEVIEAVGPDTAVLAAGGIGRGSQIAAALAMGAQGVWTGSMWLTVAEADTRQMAMDKMLAAQSQDTVRSRALTGKPARQLRTEWTDAFESEDSPGYLPMPLQYMLVSDAMLRIDRAQNQELSGFPVGQIVGAMNSVRPVRDVMFDLVSETVEAVERLSSTFADQ